MGAKNGLYGSGGVELRAALVQKLLRVMPVC